MSNVYYETNTGNYLSTLDVRNPDDRSMLLANVRYRLYNDTRGMPTGNRYVIELHVQCSANYSNVHLLKLQVFDEHSHIRICERDFQRELQTLEETQLPICMFSLHFFTCVPRSPSRRFMFAGRRTLIDNVWEALHTQTRYDWEKYQRLKVTFDQEYRRKIYQYFNSRID